MEGDNIRRIRKGLKLKLTWLAQVTGIHKGRLSHIEKNERKASLEEGFRIADAMEVDIRRFKEEEAGSPEQNDAPGRFL